MGRSRSLLARCGPEIQQSAMWIDWFQKVHPREFKYLTHIPNERKGKLQRIVLFLLGVKKGVSDYGLFLERAGYSGLWLEFKAEGRPPSAVTDEQHEWQRLMRSQGFFCAVAFGYDQAVEIATAYIKGRVPPRGVTADAVL